MTSVDLTFSSNHEFRVCFEEYVLFRWDLYSVIYGLVVLQRRLLTVADVCMSVLLRWSTNFVFRTISLGAGFELNGSFGMYATMTDIPIIFECQVADS